MPSLIATDCVGEEFSEALRTALDHTVDLADRSSGHCTTPLDDASKGHRPFFRMKLLSNSRMRTVAGNCDGCRACRQCIPIMRICVKVTPASSCGSLTQRQLRMTESWSSRACAAAKQCLMQVGAMHRQMRPGITGVSSGGDPYRSIARVDFKRRARPTLRQFPVNRGRDRAQPARAPHAVAV